MDTQQSTSWRISLRGMLAVVSFLALACIAIRFANEPWTLAALTMVSITIGFFALRALLERDRRQAFAVGFTLWGIAYCYLAANDHWPARHLVTRAITDWAHNQVAVNYEYDYDSEILIGPSSRKEVVKEFPMLPPLADDGDTFTKAFPSADHFFAVFDSLWTLLFAYLGGKLAVWIYHRRVAREYNNAKALSDDA